VVNQIANETHNKILVIDDDDFIRDTIAKILERHDYRVLQARTGAEGLEIVAQAEPDLILLDVMLPGQNGHQVCFQIRQMPRASHIPIIMLTALSDTTDKIKGIQAGADDYIAKPFDSQELRARVDMHLRRTRRDIQASPLTRLPGNKAVEDALWQHIHQTQPFAVLYIDLDNFKPYNDKYGFMAGDEVLKLLARIIVEATESQGNATDFVGHMGGDDFVIITQPPCAVPIAEFILAEFDRDVVVHYDEEDRQRGYIVGQDRQGNTLQIPIVSVSIAIVTNEHRPLVHPRQIAQIAADVKRYVKNQGGSNYAFDRRRNGDGVQ